MIAILETAAERVLRPVRTFLSLSPLRLLFIFNFLMCLTSVALVAFSVFLSVIFYNHQNSSDTTYINWIGLAIVGCVLTFVCILGMRGAHTVKLDLLLTYFWGIIICVAPLLLFCVACFNFNAIINLWFMHSWDTPTFLRVCRSASSPLLLSLFAFAAQRVLLRKRHSQWEVCSPHHGHYDVVLEHLWHIRLPTDSTGRDQCCYSLGQVCWLLSCIIIFAYWTFLYSLCVAFACSES